MAATCPYTHLKLQTSRASTCNTPLSCPHPNLLQRCCFIMWSLQKYFFLLWQFYQSKRNPDLAANCLLQRENLAEISKKHRIMYEVLDNRALQEHPQSFGSVLSIWSTLNWQNIEKHILCLFYWKEEAEFLLTPEVTWLLGQIEEQGGFTPNSFG